MNLVKMQQAIEARWDEDKERRQRWERYRRVYEGGQFWGADTPEHLSRVDCGKLFSTVSQLAPLMTDNRPRWSVRARNPAVHPVIEEWNKALIFMWGELRMNRHINAAYQDALLMEQGCLQVDWDEEEDEVRVQVVDPRHLVFQKGGHDDLEDVAWVCKRRSYTIGDVQRRYPDAVGKLVADAVEEGESIDMLEGGLDTFQASNKWCTVYELWMRDGTVEDDLTDKDYEREGRPRRKKAKYPNGRFVVFTRTGKESKPVKLADYASPFGHGKPPFVMVYDYRLSHSIWGLGEGRHLMPLIDELNDVLQSISFKIRNTCRQNAVVDSEVLDPATVKKDFHRGGQFWVKENKTARTSQHPQDLNYTGISMVEVGAPTQAEFNYVQALMDIIEDISSVTDIVAGQAGKRAEQTAQEFSGLYEAGHTRTRLRVRMLEESEETVLHRLLSLMMEGWREPRFYSVDGEDGARTYRAISNRREDAERIVSQNVDREFEQQEAAGVEEPNFNGEQDPDAAKAMALEKLMKALPVGADRVTMRFQIEVQPQSTLPTDRQSRANLALRLAQMQIIDAEETLKSVDWPDWQSVIQRMQSNLQAAQEAQQQMAGQQDAAGYGQESGIEPPALPQLVQ